MTKTITVLLILFSINTGFSQTANSIANGNWMNPLTQDCTCIPIPGYTVTIHHAVLLDTSFYIPTGGITIFPGASLIENNTVRDIELNGLLFLKNFNVATIKEFVKNEYLSGCWLPVRYWVLINELLFLIALHSFSYWFCSCFF